MHKNDFSILGFNVLNPNRISEVSFNNSNQNSDISSDSFNLEDPLNILKAGKFLENIMNSKYSSTSVIDLSPSKLLECLKDISTPIYILNKIPDDFHHILSEIPKINKIKIDVALTTKKVLIDGSVDISLRNELSQKINEFIQNLTRLENLHNSRLIKNKYPFLKNTDSKNLYVRNTYSFLEKNVESNDFIKVAGYYGKIVSENKNKGPFIVNKMFFEKILEKFYLNDESCPLWMFKICLNQCFINFNKTKENENQSSYNVCYTFSPHLNNNIIHKIHYFMTKIGTSFTLEGVNNPDVSLFTTKSMKSCSYVTSMIYNFKHDISEKDFLMTPTLFETSPIYTFSCDIESVGTIIAHDFLIPYYNHDWTPFSKKIVESLSFFQPNIIMGEFTVYNTFEKFKKAFPLDPRDLYDYNKNILLLDIYKKVGHKFDGFIPECVLKNGKKQEILIKALALSLKNVRLHYLSISDKNLITPSNIVFCKNDNIFEIKSVDFSIELKEDLFNCILAFTPKNSSEEFCIEVSDSIDYTSDYKKTPKSSIYTKKIKSLVKELIKLS